MDIFKQRVLNPMVHSLQWSRVSQPGSSKKKVGRTVSMTRSLRNTIVDLERDVIAEARSKGNELVVVEAELKDCDQEKAEIFDFPRYRRVQHYGSFFEPNRGFRETGLLE